MQYLKFGMLLSFLVSPAFFKTTVFVFNSCINSFSVKKSALFVLIVYSCRARLRGIVQAVFSVHSKRVGYIGPLIEVTIFSCFAFG